MPCCFQKATAARAMTSIFAMPRLPTPIATVAPGFSRATMPDSDSVAWTAAGISSILRLSNCCRTVRKEGKRNRVDITRFYDAA